MSGTHRSDHEQAPPLDLAAIRARLAARTPEQSAARRAGLDALRLGEEAMVLGEQHLADGDLQRAHEFFAMAARYRAADAEAMLHSVEALLEATRDPQITATVAGTVLDGERVDSRAERDQTAHRALETARLLRGIEDHAVQAAEEHRRARDVLALALTAAAQTLSTAQAKADAIVTAAQGRAAAVVVDAEQEVDDDRSPASTTAMLVLCPSPVRWPSNAVLRRSSLWLSWNAVLRRSPLRRSLPTPDSGAGSGASASVRRGAVPVTESLVEAAVDGGQEAVDKLLSAIRPAVLRYCRARLGRSSAVADNVAQEVCLAVLKALPRYRDQERPFLTLVYGIAAHKVADARRDAHRAAARDRAEPVADIPDALSVARGREEVLAQGELSERMSQMLEALPKKQREVLVLRVAVGLTAEETAAAVGSTVRAVRVAQHHALNRLRKQLTLAEQALVGQALTERAVQSAP